MSSSDTTRARPASLLLPLLNGLSPHEQAEGEETQFESRVSLVEILHCLLDAAEQRNAEDRPSGHARLTRVGLTG